MIFKLTNWQKFNLGQLVFLVNIIPINEKILPFICFKLICS